MEALVDIENLMETLSKQRKLESQISDILLDFAYMYEEARDEITTSDFQGIALAEAKKIINMLNG